jgi:hypothetical protein
VLLHVQEQITFEGSAYFLNVMSLLQENSSIISWYSWKKKLGDFSAQTYGVRAGGAIVKDKLFYFIN